MRQQRSDVAHRLFDVELHEPGPEQLQLVELPRAEHIEHVVVQLVLVDAVQLELVLVVVLHGIEQLQQLELVLVERLGSTPGHALTIGL